MGSLNQAVGFLPEIFRLQRLPREPQALAVGITNPQTLAVGHTTLYHRILSLGGFRVGELGRRLADACKGPRLAPEVHLMSDRWTYFITWNTYGSWLPGDARGWRKRHSGEQLPRPFLADWCHEQMRYESVLLSEHDRQTIHDACQKHCDYRSWVLLAVNARTNHVHLVVIADAGPKVVRDQLKANCTRRLRKQETPLNAKQPWAKGADIEILDTDDDVENCINCVLNAQSTSGASRGPAVNLRR